MKRAAVSVAFAALSLQCVCRDFDPMELKAEIESVSAKLDEISLYYQEFNDTLEMQMQSMYVQYQAAYYNDRDIDAIVNDTLDGLERRFRQASLSYGNGYNEIQSFITEQSSRMVRLAKMFSHSSLYMSSIVDWYKLTDIYWNSLAQYIPTLPNPFVLKSGTFWSSPLARELEDGWYESACNGGCNCFARHGSSNMSTVNGLLDEMRRYCVKIVDLKRHPPSM